MTEKTLFDEDLTLEEAEELIKNGADVNKKIQHGYTPLFYMRNIHIIQLLIKHGADINAQTTLGNSPLHTAYSIEIITLLIANGALLNQRNCYGESVLDYQNQMYTINKIKKIEYLIKIGAITGYVENYKFYRHLFTKEQQKAFDDFASITSNDDDFFAMCLAYQEGMMNNISHEIKDVELDI